MSDRILILADNDQFIPFDYSSSTSAAMKAMGQNSGNNIFAFSLQKMTLSKTAKVDRRPLSWIDENIEYLNYNYDRCLYSPANILGVWAKNSDLKKWTHRLKKIKIPFNFIGVGAQSDKEYNLDFTNEIKKEGYQFLKAILNTGGHIGVRGFFTGEVIKKLGLTEDDFQVIGCPSLFMNGGKTNITKKNIQKEDLKPIINGNKFWFNKEYSKIYREYPESIFIDQDLFYPLLYDLKGYNNELYFMQDGLFLEMFKQNRIKLFCNYLDWNNAIVKEGYNFSIGSRIHGNVVSLLAGIPSFVDMQDSRVRELAEFYDIPCKFINPSDDLFDLYNVADFSKFNENFASRFQDFKRFMNDIKIPCFEDEDYINQMISKLKIQEPEPLTSYEQLQEAFDLALNKKMKTKLYKFLHLYWLRGKK